MGVCITKPGEVLATAGLASDKASSDAGVPESLSCNVSAIDVAPINFHLDIPADLEERNCRTLVDMKLLSGQSPQNLIDSWEKEGLLSVIHSQVFGVSATNTTSIKELAHSLTRDSSKYLQDLSDQFCIIVAKAYAIYFWITNNIQYDTTKWVREQEEKLPILESRKGLSNDYASLFNELCSEAGLNTEKIEGNLRRWRSLTGHKFCPDEYNYHCWNVVSYIGLTLRWLY